MLSKILYIFIYSSTNIYYKIVQSTKKNTQQDKKDRERVGTWEITRVLKEDVTDHVTAAAAAKSLQSCPTLGDP